jgi:gliding motility-associated-like protein
VDTGYCNAPDSTEQLIHVAEAVKAQFEQPPTGCAPYEVEFENTSDGGQEFIWDFGDGSPLSNDFEPVHIFNAGTYTVKLKVIDSATCNIIDSFSLSISIVDKPQALFTVTSLQPPPVNTPIVFANNSSPDAIRFKWLFGDGDSLLTTSRDAVSHEYNTTRTYRVCLVAYNANDCEDSTCTNVQSVVEPAVDVPNAFTPLSGNVNSKVFVRGFAIAKLKFIIWNRWGQKVFETDSKNAGWDGKYKGVVQPMDVYAYTLEVEFTDGTKTTRRGDITLIR